MRRTAFLALAAHWRRHPLELATLLVGLMLATALWSGVQAINSEARASYARAADALGETSLAQIVPETGEDFDQALFLALRQGGWLVAPVLEGRLAAGVRLIGFDPLTMPADLAPPGAGAPDIAAFLSPRGVILAAPGTAALLAGLGPELRVVETLPPGVAYADIGLAQRLLDRPGRLSRLIVHASQPLGLPAAPDLPAGLTLRAASAQTDVARLTDSFHLNLTAFGLLSFAVGLFIVHGAIGLAFEERRGLFRTLRALGLPLSGLIFCLLAELTLLALLAGSAGMVLGYGIATALLPDVAATLRGLYGAEVAGALSLRPGWWAAGIAMTLAGTATAAASGLWRVARMPILAPARPRAWARASAGRLRLQSFAALALLGAGLAAPQLLPGLFGGFALLGGLLVGAALALPVLLHMALAIPRPRGALGQWFLADTRQQLPGLSLALMALLLALSANIGVGTMVSSFRLTFTGWLDQRLVSDLYVTARDEAEARALAEFLTPRARAVLPIWHVETRLSGRPAEIYGVADDEVYRRNWPMLQALPQVWDMVTRGEGILVNEQLARRAGYAPGDPIALPGGWSSTVAGIYSDYGNPGHQAIIALPLLLQHYPEAPRLRLGVLAEPGTVAVLAAALRDEFGLPADLIVDQASVKAFSLGVFERTFAVTAALNLLTLSVAGIAILTSLLTLAAQRLPQLAPVWALGLTRRRLAALELARALVLAGLTICAAIPLGLVLAWVLLAVINVQAFGWRLPMYLFPADWLRLAGLSLAAAALAALWPALRLARTPPAALLKVFAHAR